MTVTERAGRVLFFLLWPAFFVYFYHTERTRIILVYEGKLLVIKHWLSDGRWSLPGGGVQSGETPRAGAVREMFEETGIQLHPDQLTELGTGVWRAYGLRYRFRSFVVVVDQEPISLPRYVTASRLERLYLVWRRPNELLPDETNPDVMSSIAMLQERYPDFLIQ
jgi:8-oxo-dGTP pyrophosphatase MutT (NUDIX family)